MKLALCILVAAGALAADVRFSFEAPEGNYNVKVTVGDATESCSATIRSESRRLMVEQVRTAPGQLITREFAVNVRYPEIDAAESVRLKPREIGKLDWDHKLTLDVTGTRPCVSAVEATKADVVTVYLAGDSTVTDQDEEPWAAWGQMLPRFFKPGVAVANYAESGESAASFIREKRLQKILSVISAGDYLFIQFAHNDQKERGENIGPFTTYKASLKLFVAEARKRGAIPVFVTSMHRRTFGEDGKIVNSLGDYPEAMRQAAKEENVPLIDLHAMSQVFYEVLGPERSTKAFVHYAAGTFPGQTEELKDNTHFNSYGAYELARCMVEGIRANKLGIAAFLADDAAPFDASHPDPPGSVPTEPK